ncbi:alginate lyase family protein [Ruficoccus amylovorans]|uniref:Alginate lyase family protein n=1 Tax=Ruficoccus amylovorans TaxID=1804625 RepID=A0A842HFX9_9BACT|nr:alginate lyase family protein [Ruficoccus amylovorans]MBC2595179.1 alginate lyase family protein [Ruficoccus amylovorans]
MNYSRALILALSLLPIAVSVRASLAGDDPRADGYQELYTVADVCEIYPEQVEQLFEALDLDTPGLEAVKAAYQSGDTVRASELLLAYYHDHPEHTAQRIEIPLIPNETDITDITLADLILEDRMTSYELTAPIARRSNGRVDWYDGGPQDDKQWAAKLNRHIPLRTLYYAYRQTGNPAYIEKLDELMRDWIVSSLPAYTADTPQETRLADRMWRPMEMGIRIHGWGKFFYGLQDSGQFRPATRLLMLCSIVDHGRGLRKDHSLGGNHATLDLSGLATCAVLWPELSESDEWFTHAADYLGKDASEQFYPDGVHEELTAGYHAYAAGNYERLANAARSAGKPLSPELQDTLQKAWNYYALIMLPDGSQPANNDSGLSDSREIILKYAAIYNRPDWLYIATNGEQGERPKGLPSRMFPWAGHLIMRDGWGKDAQWAMFDAGPAGPGFHAHYDRMHLSLMAYGRNLLVDTDKFAYQGEVADKFREPYAVHSRGHNVILIDGKGQTHGPSKAEAPLPKDQYAITETFDYARYAYDKFEELTGQAEHERAIFYVRGKFWIVVDRITSSQPRQIEALWHYHPDCTVVLDGEAVASVDPGVGNLRIEPVGQLAWHPEITKGQEEPTLQGWFSRIYGQYEPSPAAVYKADIGQGATDFAWLLLPYRGEKAPAARVRILSDTEAGLQVEVKLDDERYVADIPLTSAMQPALSTKPQP